MVTTHITTAAELLEMGSDPPFELIMGELVRVSPSSTTSNIVLNYINWELFSFVRAGRLGSVSVAEGGYLVETNPDTVVAPDIAFVARERMPKPLPERGYWRVCPDLIVEVISPTDESREIRSKQALYDRIRVPMVWWVDPQRKVATVHIPGQPIRKFDENGTLDGGVILPGFTLELANVFEEH